MNKKSKSGISLIVLIITIIVVIILAGTVIINLSDTNVINLANKAAYIGDTKNFQTELDLYETNQFSDKLGMYDSTKLQADETSVAYNGIVDNTKTINDLIPSLGKAAKYSGEFVVVDGKLVFQGIDTNKQDWSREAEIPVQVANRTFSGAITGFSYDNPVIPAGFVAINTEGANWDNLSTDWDKGLVIQDATGNQFVWVPVDGTNVLYEKWCTNGKVYSNTLDDTLPSGFNSSNITTKYKGFYIARYESMFDYNGGSIRVASKKSSNISISGWLQDSNHTGNLWNQINYTDSKTYAEKMSMSYGYDTTKVGTNLITGSEWDTVMKWIQNSGYNVTDSRAFGNYTDSIDPANVSGYTIVQISGYSEYWKSKNIYDLAGNTWEWSNELCSSCGVNPIYRGGSCHFSGIDNPAAYRKESTTSYTADCLAFRVALYVL